MSNWTPDMDLSLLKAHRLKKRVRTTLGWKVSGDRVAEVYEGEATIGTGEAQVFATREEAQRALTAMLERQAKYDQVLKIIEKGQAAHRSKIERADKVFRRRKHTLAARLRCREMDQATHDRHLADAERECHEAKHASQQYIDADWKQWNECLLSRLDQVMPQLWPILDQFREENGSLQVGVPELKEALREISVTVAEPRIKVKRTFERNQRVWVKRPRERDVRVRYDDDKGKWLVERRMTYSKRVLIRSDNRRQSDRKAVDRTLIL